MPLFPLTWIGGAIRLKFFKSRCRQASGFLEMSNDLLIAAIALANDLTLVTHNTREFGRINGLKYEDWE